MQKQAVTHSSLVGLGAMDLNQTHIENVPFEYGHCHPVLHCMAFHGLHEGVSIEILAQLVTCKLIMT